MNSYRTKKAGVAASVFSSLRVFSLVMTMAVVFTSCEKDSGGGIGVGNGNIPTGYYSDAYGKSGQALKTELHHIIKDHTVRTYDNLWTDFRLTDARPEDPTKVWDMYSDVPSLSLEEMLASNKYYVYTFVKDKDPGTGGGSEGEYYNREHSMPKSWFNDAKPAYSDLFHLYPTDKKVNSLRSNMAFGVAESGATSTINGSKTGSMSVALDDSNPGVISSISVFEPIDEYKGDFARTYFYMVTRYENINLGQANGGIHTIKYSGGKSDLKDWAVTMFIEWHELDPVSEKEIKRNEAIYGLQNNRNPYIDHPTLVDHIWGDQNTTPFTVSSNQ